MSIETKKMLIHDIQKKVGSSLTVDKTQEVMKLFSEELSNYNLERNAYEDSDAEGEQLLEAYISAKRIEGRSQKTLQRYNYIIRKMMENINAPLRKISIFHIRQYFAKEKERGISDRTLQGIREVLSAYFNWLFKEGLIQTNPMINLGAIKYQKQQKLPYSAVDIEKLKENCKTVRDKAIICFLLSTGCRIGEVCALNIQDIDFEAQECIVLGKGNKQRVVFLDDVATMFLKRYLDNRKDDNQALFMGKRGNRLTPSGVRYMLHSVAERAGVENTHPHRFRRTLITNLIDHGMPIQQVKILAGHDKIDTTIGYIYTDKMNVKNSFKKYM